MNKITLYHGTGIKYSKPDLNKSREDIDFGKGYYLTTDENMSKKWASTKENSYVYKYELDIENLNIYYFKLDEEWLDFIINNRNGKKTHNYDSYDALVGAIANDKMYSTLSDYESGLLTKKQTIELLNIGGFSEQFVIKNKKTLDKLILISTNILSNEEKEKIKEQVINERITVSKMTEEYRRQAVKKEWENEI